MTRRGHWNDKRGRWDDRRSGRKRKCWDDIHRPVIPARDAGIWEFYQVGEYKSCVKMHYFYGKLDPSVTHWDDKKRGYWGDEKRVLE